VTVRALVPCSASLFARDVIRVDRTQAAKSSIPPLVSELIGGHHPATSRPSCRETCPRSRGTSLELSPAADALGMEVLAVCIMCVELALAVACLHRKDSDVLVTHEVARSRSPRGQELPMGGGERERTRGQPYTKGTRLTVRVSVNRCGFARERANDSCWRAPSVLRKREPWNVSVACGGALRPCRHVGGFLAR
jgi:hypothetical protein